MFEQDKPKMTIEILNVVGTFEAAIAEELNRCIPNLITADAAGAISLPQTSASGIPVTHGARMTAYNIAEYWAYRLYMLHRMIGERMFLDLTGFRTVQDIRANKGVKLATVMCPPCQHCGSTEPMTKCSDGEGSQCVNGCPD